MSGAVNYNPEPMRYTGQAIVLLAADLERIARGLQGKRETAGDARNSAIVSLVVPGQPINQIDNRFCGPGSRLILVGHGVLKATHLVGDGDIQWDGEMLARRVIEWVGGPRAREQRIGRISLHVCFGGGNRGATRGTEREILRDFTVRPNQSLAWNLARCVGCIAVSVTARTDVVGGQIPSRGGRPTFQRVVGENDRHHAYGDKYVFWPARDSHPDNQAVPMLREPGQGAPAGNYG